MEAKTCVPPLLKNIRSWEFELHNDKDRDYILSGIRRGFSLIDPEVDIDSMREVFMENSAFISKPGIANKVTSQIYEKLDAGKDAGVLTSKPKVVSALTAVSKPNGEIRLIHDLSRPENYCVNSFVSKDKNYQSVNDALLAVKPCSYMAKVDLKSPYRSVHIREQEHTHTGLRWSPTGKPHDAMVYDETRAPRAL